MFFPLLLVSLLISNLSFAVVLKKQSRTVSLSSHQNVQAKKYQNLIKDTFVIDNEEFVLVPKRLVKYKTERYLTEASTAVVAMSCCKSQIHRKCLREIFHGKDNNSSNCCMGEFFQYDRFVRCNQIVNRNVFATSNAHFISVDRRHKKCCFCKNDL